MVLPVWTWGSGGKSRYNKQRAQLGTYQNFCSGIASQDIEAYDAKPQMAIKSVRDWLQTNRRGLPRDERPVSLRILFSFSAQPALPTKLTLRAC
jgi:hypothetical protein